MIHIIILIINLVNYYLMAATNKRLLISESHGDSNWCTPCRGKPDQHTTYAFHVSPRMLPAGGPHTWQPFTLTQQSWTDSLLPRKSAPDFTSQPGWVVRGTYLSFSPKTAIEAVCLHQTSVDNMLLGLSGAYHRHAIGTFNTCSRVPTPQSLIDIGGGYHIENLRIATTLSLLFPSEGSTNPPNGPARSQIIHNNYQLNWRVKQALNLMSGSLHSTSTITYHLCIAWANDAPLI
jgi:hypothetical protein